MSLINFKEWRGSSRVSKGGSLSTVFSVIIIATVFIVLFMVNGHSSGVVEGATCFGLLSNNTKVCSGRGACTADETCSCFEGFNGVNCRKNIVGTDRSVLLGKDGQLGDFQSNSLLSYPSTLFTDGNDFLVADLKTIIKFKADGTVVSKSPAKSNRFVMLSDGSFLYHSGLEAVLMTNNKSISVFVEGKSTSPCYISSLSLNPSDGFLYGSDYRNSILFKIDPKTLSGDTTTCTIIGGIYGSYGFQEEQALSSKVYTPLDIVFKENELFFSDMRNMKIRKIDRYGRMVTVVSGLNGTSALAFSPSGTLHFLEIGSKYIGRVDSRGVISRVVSLDFVSYMSSFIFVDDNTILYSDYHRHVVRLIKLEPKCEDTFMTGDDCSKVLVKCNSVDFNSPTVCSSHGTCFGNNNCTCSYGYYGQDCELHGCFGIPATSSKVCGGKGQCSALNTCQCNSGFFGKDCTSHSCYGKTGDDSNVCSGNGFCTGTDTCTCFDGYYGQQCQSKFASISYITRKAIGTTLNLDNMCADGNDVLLYSYNGLFKFSNTNLTRLGEPSKTYNQISTLECTEKFIYFSQSWAAKILKKERVSGDISTVVDFSNGISLPSNGKSVVFNGYISGFTYTPEYGFIISFNNVILRFSEETGSIELLAGVPVVIDSINYQEIYSVPPPSYQHMIDPGDGVVPIMVAPAVETKPLDSGSISYYGIGNQITLNSPTSLLVYKGSVYFVESGVSFIRKVDLSTTYVSIVAGLPNSRGYIANYQNAKQTSIYPLNTAGMFFLDNELYFADSSNYLIRKVSKGVLVDVAGIPKKVQSAPTMDVDSLKSAFSYMPNRIVQTRGNIFIVDGNVPKYLEKYYTCSEGFTGYMCKDTLKCNGVSLLDPNVCGGHGKCSQAGCSCEYGYTGQNCNVPTCFGFLATDNSVCNGKGSCTAVDKCVCTDTNYFGQKCSDFSCNGTPKNSSSVCNGRGLCNSPDNCLCFSNSKDGFWKDSNCNSCKSPFTGSECLTLPVTNTCEDAITCLGNGKCGTDGKCVCSGNYTGSNCNQCKTGYYGPSCDVHCLDGPSCSSNGFCDERLRGGCTCFSSPSTGYWTGTSCNKCQDGYYGSNCATRIIGPAVLSNFGNSISFKLYAPPSYTRTTIDIWRLIKNNEWTVGNWGWGNFGTNPKAYWTNKEQGDFVIEFGDNYAIKPDVSQFEIRTTVFDTYHYWESPSVLMTFSSPSNPTKPTAKLVKKKLSFGSCENLIIDGSLSYSGDRQALVYHWSISSTTVTDAIAVALFSERVANQTDAKFVIPTDKFPAGTHTIQLIVESSLFGVKSDSDIITVTKGALPLPIISVSGKNTFTVNRQSVPLLIKKGVLLPSCVANDTQIISTWNQLSGPAIDYIMDNYGNLVITKFKTIGVQTYVFEASAALSTSPSNKAVTSVTIITYVQPMVLTSKISSLTFDSASAEITFKDPEESTDSETWAFSCYPNNCGNKVNEYLSTSGTAKSTSLTFSRNDVNQTVISTGSSFNIKLIVTKGSRNVETDFVFYFPKSAEEIPPVISLWYRTGAYLNPTDWIYLSYSVTVNGTWYWYYSDVKCDWLLDGVPFTNNDYWRGPWFSMSAGEFEEGRTYTLTFVATYKGVSAYQDYVFTINRTPRCTCVLNPASVFAMDEQLTISCPNCQVADLSYEISFGFYDSYIGNEIYLYSAQDNSFSTPLPTKRWDWGYGQMFVKITDKNTGAKITKYFYVNLFNPVASSIIDVSNKVEKWNLISSSVPEGDPAKYIYNSVSISNAMKYMLSIIDPNPTSTRKLRGSECNGNGNMVNGVCNCHQNYSTSDCKYSYSDFKFILKMKGKLFQDFISGQNKRNTSIEIITEDIMTGTLQGLQSFLSDIDYLTSDVFSSSLVLLDNILGEALGKEEFAISSSLASSYINVLDNIIEYTTKNGTLNEHKKRVKKYVEQITSLVKRGQLAGQSTLRFASENGVYVTGKGYLQDLNTQSIKYSEDNSTMPLYVILPSTISNVLNSASSKEALTHTLTVINDMTQIKETVEGFRNISGIPSNRTIVSPYIVQWKMDDYEITNLTSRIIYQIPLTKSLNNGHKLREKNQVTFYYCQYLDSNGNPQQDSTCTISFASNQVAQCECSMQTAVFVVESVELRDVDLTTPVITCNGVNSDNSSVCNGNGNCTENEVCVCKSGYSGVYCNIEPTTNTDSSSTTNSNNSNTTTNTTNPNNNNSNTTTNTTNPDNNNPNNTNTNSTSSNNSTSNNSTNTDSSTNSNNSNTTTNTTNPNNNNSNTTTNSTSPNTNNSNTTYSNNTNTSSELTFESNILLKSESDLTSISPSQDLVFTFTTSQILSSPEYEWKSENIDLSDLNCKNSFLTIPKSKLTIYGKQITIYLIIQDGSKSSSSSISFSLNAPPTVGTFTVSPKNGIASDTKFSLSCLNSIDSNLPLTYTFYYLDESTSVWKALGDRSQESALVTTLPLGFDSSSTLRIKVAVYDAKLVFSEKETSVIVVKPTMISESTISNMLQKASSKSVTSSFITATLDVISSVVSSNTSNLEQIKSATNAIVTSYLESLQSAYFTSENGTAAVSALSSVSSCLKFIQDSTTSSVITELTDLIKQAATSSAFNLDDTYLTLLKSTTDKLYEHVKSRLGKARSFTSNDMDLLDEIYQYIGKAFMKNTAPDMPASIITTKSYASYWRKVLVSSLRNVVGEVIDGRNKISILGELAKHPTISSLSSITLYFKTQLPSEESIDMDFNIDEVSSLTSENSIVQIQLLYSNPEDDFFSCTYWNEKINQMIEGSQCTMVQDSSIISANIKKTGRFRLSREQPRNYGLLTLLTMLALPILFIISGVLIVVYFLKKRKTTKSSAIDIEMKANY